MIDGVRGHLTPILVIDDGSADATATAAAAAGAEVVRLPVNQGKGAALLTGFRALAERGFTHALTLDADGQHLPDQIPALLAASAAAPDALVVGVRRKAGHEIRPINKFGNRVADWWITKFAGQPLPDTQCGFRVYPIASVLALRARGARFDFETEILLRAARAGIPIASVPVQVYYPPIGERVTHYRPFVDTVRIIRTVLGVLFGS